MRQSIRCGLSLIQCLALSLSALLAAIPTARVPETGTWTQLPLYSGAVLSLAINPTTPSTLYFGRDGQGVFRSIDSGATWTAVSAGLTDYVRRLAITP